MWRWSRSAALCAAIVSAVAGCAPFDDPVPDKYGVMSDRYVSRSFLRSVSTLVAIDEAGELNVCVQVSGAASAPADYESRIRAAVQHAADSWNALLNEPPPPDAPDLRFPPWIRESVAINFTCSGSRLYSFYGNTSNDRAYAQIARREVQLDTSCVWNDRRLRNVVMHEYGHLMGLSDTYTEPEVGLDVYGQPASMMQSSWSLTDDDRAGIWNLWRYLELGGDPCGPGYDVQAVNSWGTYCILSADEVDGGGDSGCAVGCSDYDVTPGDCFADASAVLWECDDRRCLNRVLECSGDDDAATCEILCSWHDLEPGGCTTRDDGSSWACDAEGCLHRVESCGGDGGGGDGDGGGDGGSSSDCTYDCSDYGQSPGDCYRDRNGNSWQCDSDGCLDSVTSCPVACRWDCSILGIDPGECIVDRNGNSWRCTSSRCLEHVTSC